jgi:pimeloyl-ACP methyl ester carboxylesterase
MATFVLVHGEYLGGWCWRLLAPVLREAGHEVYTPTLSGLGDRSAMLSPDIGLDTQIEDVANLLIYEDLSDVILVGHGYGGAVVTGVAELMARRVAHLVYLDAFILRDGESVWGHLSEEEQAFIQLQLNMNFETWKLPPQEVADLVEVAWVEGWSEALASWSAARLSAQPLKPAKDAIKLRGGGAFDALPRTYIRCTLSQEFGLPDMVERAKASGWPLIELQAGHTPQISAPELLIPVLLQIAEPDGA